MLILYHRLALVPLLTVEQTASFSGKSVLHAEVHAADLPAVQATEDKIQPQFTHVLNTLYR